MLPGYGVRCTIISCIFFREAANVLLSITSNVMKQLFYFDSCVYVASSFFSLAMEGREQPSANTNVKRKTIHVFTHLFLLGPWILLLPVFV